MTASETTATTRTPVGTTQDVTEHLDEATDDEATDEGKESGEPDGFPIEGADENAENYSKKRLFTRPRLRRGTRRSVSVRALMAFLAVVAAVAVIAVLGWKVHSQSRELAAHRADSDGRRHAEQVALDYSVGAAQMDYRDENAWTVRLTKGTSPDLSNRLRQAADSMQQLTVPMQWSSTAQPIAAKVMSDNNGVYQVVCFVDVLTKNVQASNGIQSTATYRMTINKNDNWQITDISGIGPAEGTKPAGG